MHSARAGGLTGGSACQREGLKPESVCYASRWIRRGSDGSHSSPSANRAGGELTLVTAGEGVRFTVEGNPVGDPSQQVRDADLALLVDGLFEAGAEAISINDERLNTLGAIRNTGAAIHVNTRPLTAPYVVRAIGDTRTLQADLLETTHGSDFFSLADQLGFIVSRQNVDQMSLPAARKRPLRQVRAVNPGAVTPGIEKGAG